MRIASKSEVYILKESIKKLLLYDKQAMEERRKLAEKTMSFLEPVIDAARKTYSLYKHSIQMVIKEQELVEEQWIYKGYAYSSSFHILSLLTYETQEEDFIDKLFEYEFFEHVLKTYEEIEESNYIKNVFETFNKENLTHHIPFLTLLVERLMRILTDNLDTHSLPFEIKKLINKSLVDYERKEPEELSDEESNEISRLHTVINKNTKKLILSSYLNIIENDLFKTEAKAKGNILNRHRVLHGKQDFDKMTEEDAVKICYTILLFIDLINLKNTGNLIIKNNLK